MEPLIVLKGQAIHPATLRNYEPTPGKFGVKRVL